MKIINDKNIAVKTAVEKGYVVSLDGCLYKNKKLIKTFEQKGYKLFSIRIPNKKYPLQLKLHKLQAYQKFGDKLFEKGVQVRHFNGNSLDNSWDNILIGTNSDNQMDIPKEIRIRSATIASRKMQDQIRSYEERCLIYEDLKNNVPYSEISLNRNVVKSSLSYMKNKSKEYKKYIEL